MLDLTLPAASAADSGALAQTQTAFGGNRYRVERVLGVGGQKIVYLVLDQELDRRCALSLIHDDAVGEREIKRLREEARAVARLGAHPHLVTVFDIGEQDGRPFIVSEYLEGGDLRHELVAAGGRLTVERSRQVTLQLLDALDLAHKKGLVHRDVKPDNIWLTAQGVAKLGDFGLALGQVQGAREAATPAVVGTPYYMAPEQVRGDAVDARCDLYATGCQLFELVTGTPPFTGSLASVLNQHLTKAPASVRDTNPTASVELDALIAHLLAKAPDDRPASAELAAATLKGLTATGDEATSLRPVGGPASLQQLAHLPFVGREAEIEVLRSAWMAALRGQGCCVMISGEAGMGKSRLVQEFSLAVRAGRGTVLQGRCAPEEGAAPYLPFIDALEAPLRRAQTKELGEGVDAVSLLLSRLLPPLAMRLGHTPLPEQAAAAPDRSAVFQAVVEVLRGLAAEAGLFLIIEDIHWADQSTLDLLGHLVRRLDGSRVVVVVTHRSDEAHSMPRLTTALRALRREPGVHWQSLDGLEPAALDRLIAEAGGGDLPPERVRALRSQTAGNPLFVAELLKVFAEAAPDNGGTNATGSLTGSGQFELPEGIQAVLARRLTPLDAACRQLLRLAAAIGDRFRWDVLLAVSGGDEDQLLDHLDDALRAQVLAEVGTEGGGSFAFTNDLLRQLVYAELSTPRRLRLHLRIAEALVEVDGDQGRQLGEIARHYFESAERGGREAAVTYGTKAAKQALQVFAYEKAVGHFGRVLELLTPASTDATDGPLIAALEGRARALCALGRWPDAAVDMESALGHPTEGDDRHRMRLLLLATETHHWAMRTKESVRYAEQACALAVELGDTTAEGTAQIWLAIDESRVGALDQAQKHYARANVLAPDQLMSMRGVHSASLSWAGRHAEAHRTAAHHLALSEAAISPPEQLFALSQMGRAEMGLARYDDALGSLNKVREIGEKYGILMQLARGTAMAAGLHNILRNHGQARALSEEARELGRRIEFLPPVISSAFDIINSHLAEGDIGSAEVLCAEVPPALEKIKGFHEWIWRIRFEAIRARIALEKGDAEAALSHADQTIAWATVRPAYRVTAGIIRGQALASLGQPDRARQALDEALQLARQGEDVNALFDALSARVAYQDDGVLRLEAQATVARLLAGLTKPELRQRLIAAPDVAAFYTE